jgi:hypothetical protein
VDTWTLLHTFADDATYASTATKWQEYLDGQANGTPPFTLAISWEDVPLPTTLLATYPGAAAAYSLRLIGDGMYTGDAIRVRRASDNTEQDIGFDVNGDLDTSALTTFCAGTNGFVRTWYDQSGNANDLTKTTAADQPKIYDASTGVTIHESVNVVDFVSLDFMQSPAGVIGNVTGFSFAFVGAFKVGTILFAASDGAYGNVNNWMALRQASGLNQFTVNVAGNINVNNGTVDTSLHVFFGSFIGGTSAQLAVDGSNATTATAVGSINISQELDLAFIDNGGSAIIKSNQYTTELIVWPSDQSANRAGIETNINDYYSIY